MNQRAAHLPATRQPGGSQTQGAEHLVQATYAHGGASAHHSPRTVEHIAAAARPRRRCKAHVHGTACKAAHARWRPPLACVSVAGSAAANQRPPGFPLGSNQRRPKAQISNHCTRGKPHATKAAIAYPPSVSTLHCILPPTYRSSAKYRAHAKCARSCNATTSMRNAPGL